MKLFGYRHPVLVFLSIFTFLLLAVTACPKVIREPPLTPPTHTAAPRTTACHAGAPWVRGPEGWSQADRLCANLNGRPVCCRTRSPYGGTRHACAPQSACLPDESAEGLGDAGAATDATID